MLRPTSVIVMGLTVCVGSQIGLARPTTTRPDQQLRSFQLPPDFAPLIQVIPNPQPGNSARDFMLFAPAGSGQLPAGTVQKQFNGEVFFVIPCR